jgi:uncharacterized protein YutE (UPF0331/DUF86 family)
MNEVLANKIESIRRCIARIEAVRPATHALLVEQLDAQDILALNLERAVQMAVDVATHILAGIETSAPDTMSDCFRRLNGVGVIDDAITSKMTKAVGFRNIAVHAYRDIDWKIVFSISTQAPADFREFVRQIMAWDGEQEKS